RRRRPADHPRAAHFAGRVVERGATVAPLPEPPTENLGVEVGRTTDIDGGNLDVAHLAIRQCRGHQDSFESLRSFKPRYPPAMAPTIQNGSAPDATASGSRASGGSRDRSSLHAKNRSIGRRSCVTWSRIVPRSIG